MHFLDLTLPTPAENLALDEALLDEAEASGGPQETLRVWEPAAPLVVVGRSSRVADEVRVDVCRADGVPVLRRASGGAAIVSGPGCLMYAVVLSHRLHPMLRSVDQAHRYVLDRLTAALRAHAPTARCRGVSDLALGDLKCSGNSLRAKRDHLVYHGTLLYNFSLPLVERYLAMPPRTPDYRQGRSHGSFIANLPLAREILCRSLVEAFAATEPRAAWPQERTALLVRERYGRAEWNL